MARLFSQYPGKNGGCVTAPGRLNRSSVRAARLYESNNPLLQAESSTRRIELLLGYVPIRGESLMILHSTELRVSHLFWLLPSVSANPVEFPYLTESIGHKVAPV